MSPQPAQPMTTGSVPAALKQGRKATKAVKAKTPKPKK